MSRFFRRAVVFLVALIAFLQFIHFTLVSRLQNKNGLYHISEYENISLSTEPEPLYTVDDVRKDRELMYRSLQSLSSVLDFSGEYRIIKNFVPAQSLNVNIEKGFKIQTLDGFDQNQNSYRRNDVSIVSHSTIHHLNDLNLLSKRWSGLMSIAVFAISFQELPLLIEKILLLRFCNDRIRRQASFHLIYPLNITSTNNLPNHENILKLVRSTVIDTHQWSSGGVCSSITSAQESPAGRSRSFSAKLNYDHQIAYPNNLLRNIAKRYSFTELNLVIDIDLVPSADLYEHFIEFAKRNNVFESDSFVSSSISSSQTMNNVHRQQKTVYVLPTYEIDLESSLSVEQEDEEIPKTKRQLQDAIKHHKIRPFYFEVCWKCQKYTDYEAWLQVSLAGNNSSSSSMNRIDILYDVLWHDPWEPFYFGSKDVPYYDERFRQYGFNRISQLCELNMAEYRFAVIDNAFLVHKGFKKHDAFHPQRDIELERNRLLFRQFKTELRERYPKSPRRC